MQCGYASTGTASSGRTNKVEKGVFWVFDHYDLYIGFEGKLDVPTFRNKTEIPKSKRDDTQLQLQI
jgi:hypothetical protein